ncbi:hypothetical protein AK830_g7029 [Neonectria ditissima]|uniref:Cobalamin-independent methionine synthase MetE C-terminal/archaeal domain-containing protein n=1 Tax=Neonectria ditissima TaxID=78410 RepID=A0A0P7BGY6_9HYPO|nr:hypothetical protein AK830_g7029 [Neonectria ditissima]
MAPLFRADQVGSLIRPSSLLDARKDLGVYSDELDEAQLAATTTAIAQAVQKQLDLSIRPITSGEYERTGFFSGFFEKLQGMQANHHFAIPGDFRTELPTTQHLAKFGVKEFAAVAATGKIKHVTSAYLSGWNMLQQVVPPEHWKDCKITMPSITWQHLQLAEGRAYSTSAYQSGREYLADLALAFRQEVGILYDAGLRSIQVDDPHLTYFVLDKFKDGLRHDGVDPDELLDLYIWAHNEAIKDLPADLHVGVHLCRGNMPGTKGFLDGSYEIIAERILTRLNFNTFYLEFDDARSGSFDCLRYLPQGKSVVLGLVSTKIAELEDAKVLESRIHEAAGAIAASQGRSADQVLADSLAISPQCGFASFNANRGVATEERMWEKLTLVRDVARKIWDDAV